MARYKVELSAQATVSAIVYIDSDDKDTANERALQLAFEGNLVWTYEGVDNESVEVDQTTVEL